MKAILNTPIDLFARDENDIPAVDASERAVNVLDKKPNEHDAKTIETLVEGFMSDKLAGIAQRNMKQQRKTVSYKNLPYYQAIPLRELLSALAVQRPLIHGHIKKIVENFDPKKVAKYGDKKVAELMANSGIIRNRLKVSATIGNAKAYLALEKSGQAFDEFLWGFVKNKPIQNKRRSLSEIPARSPESDAMSKALLKADFKFVGSTICYAFMQASGMVNDHLIACRRYSAVKKISD